MSLTDAYGRKMEYLRISLTDKCNLRCKYCMPDGVVRIRHEDILTLEETIRIAGILTDMGIRRIRLTGGEPLVRKGIDGFVRELGRLPAGPELALTTNGVLLTEHLESFWESGLRSVNISLDTLDPAAYRELTGRDELPAVFTSLEKALEMGFRVKLNVVPIRGINEGEITGLAAMARDKNVDVRFIELMPIGCAGSLRGIPGAEVLKILEEKFGPAEKAGEAQETGSPHPEKDGEAPMGLVEKTAETMSGIGPAEYVRFRGFRGRVGFINPLSASFCRDCNRLRLTAEGQLKLCLYYPDGLDVKKYLRCGADDSDIAQAIRDAVYIKPKAHGFCETGAAEEKRSMFEIGG